MQDGDNRSDQGNGKCKCVGYLHFLHEDGPVAFDASAAHLLCYFPEMEMESVFCSDSKRHRIIQGFALEPVLERLAQYPCLVDDDCIRIMCVL